MSEMAAALGVSSAFLSSVETGRKAIPAEWQVKVAKILSLDANQKRELAAAIESSATKVSIELRGRSAGHRDAAIAFARSFDSLSTDDLKAIKAVVAKRGGGVG